MKRKEYQNKPCKKKIKRKATYQGAFGIILLFLIVFTRVNAFDITQREGICNTLNFTFVECGDLWEYYDKWENGTLIEYINVTRNITVNHTIIEYVNVTKEVNATPENTLQWQQAEWDHEYRMAQIMETETQSEDLYTKEQVDLKISEALVATRNNPVVRQQEDTDYTYWIILGVIILGGGFFVYNKWIKRDNDFGEIPTFNPSDTPYYSRNIPAQGGQNDKGMEGNTANQQSLQSQGQT